MQSLADERASALYRSVGFTANKPPNLFRFARALYGAGALSIHGRVGERGAIVRSLSRERCHIYLHRGATDAENTYSIAEEIARFEVQREPGVDPRLLALAIALPREVLEGFHAEGKSSEQIAALYCLPVDVVKIREEIASTARSARQLRSASAFPQALPDASDAG